MPISKKTREAMDKLTPEQQEKVKRMVAERLAIDKLKQLAQAEARYLASLRGADADAIPERLAEARREESAKKMLAFFRANRQKPNKA